MRRCLAYVLFSSAVLVGCGQSVGEKCQIDSDCKSGLVCNTGTGLCQPTNQDAPSIPGPDANVDAGPIDAPGPDAKPADARPIDAMPADAM